jgi:hypothetical protein
VIEPKGSGSLSSALDAADTMADPVSTEPVQRIGKRFFTGTAVD